MNKYNNPRLLNTVVSGTGMKNPVRPHVIIGSEKNGFIRGDLMDANAVKEAVAEEVAERIDADLNLSEEIDTKVRQAVDDLVDGAPEVLDTLKELSEALGDDANFVTTITEEIASKVDKVEGKGLSTNDYTTAEKQKLAGIAEGAEVNVQSDWNVTNSSNDAFIKNKPTKLSQFNNDALYATVGELQNVKKKYINSIYKKTPDLCDILYSDGTISAEVISDKTPVAICVDDGTYFNDGIARFATGIIAEEKWSVDQTDTNATSHTDGKSNTNALTGNGFPAAAACINYRPGTHDGEWYLPASDELCCMYEKLSMLRHTYEHCGMGSLPSGLSSWSSTQTSALSAIVALDNLMIAMSSLKTGKQKVIAFLTISTFTESGKIVDIESALPKYDPTNGHEYVDLGLPSGTLWATCNVGAHSPEEYGDYYMYGMGNKTYDAADTPYDGTEDPLDLNRDTARQVMGGAWHTPTAAQMEELMVNTTYRWVTNYKGSGINGGLFTATNGAVLFIPAAGFLDSGSQSLVGNNGYYWGSSPNGSNGAYGLSFGNGSEDVDDSNRKYGFSVRGVINPEDVNKTFVPVASKEEIVNKDEVIAAALNDLNLRKVDAETGKTLSSNDFTNDYKNKLDSIASNAEKNVQADWNVTSMSSDAYIKNKPTVITQSHLEDDEYVLAQAITTLNTKLHEANIEIEDLKLEMDIDDLTSNIGFHSSSVQRNGTTTNQYDDNFLASLVQGTNNRYLLTTTYLGKKLTVGSVLFFTDNMAHQITAIATTNIELDAWSLDSTLSHTDGEVNTYVTFYGWNNPPEYSGLEEGVWTDWKKLYMTRKDAQDMYAEVTVARNTMSSNTFDGIFEITDPNELIYIVEHWNPVIWIITNNPVGLRYPFMLALFMSDGNTFTVITTRFASATNSFEMKYKTAVISGDTVTWDSDWTYIHGSAPILA